MEQGAEGEGDEDEDKEMNQNEAVDDGECLFLNTLFLFMYTSRCLVGYPFFLEGLVPFLFL